MRAHRVRSTVWIVAAASCAVLVLASCARREPPVTNRRELADGWQIRAAAEVTGDGAALSTPGFDAAGWLATSVPATPMAALVANGRYPDLYVGTNLERVSTEQFAGPWWYRTEFELSKREVAGAARLVFEGINYRANVWLNGVRLASSDEIVGAFRVHSLDLAGRVRPGVNALAVEVLPPQPGDFTIGFVDWNPRPPDRNMGLWRPVVLRLTGPVSVDEVFVRSDVDLDTLATAELAVDVLVANHGDEAVTTTVRGELEGQAFQTEVALEPGQQTVVRFTAEEHPLLRLEAPRLWWPHTLGRPELYSLRATAFVDDRVSDATDVTFGVREVGTYFNPEGHRGFTVNGRPVLIRGGGWVDDLLLADTPAKLEAQIAYVKHMGLNTIRLEGFWGSSHTLYDIADREGVLIMPGWSCQWEWEDYLGTPVDERYGGVLTPEDQALVAASLDDQVRYLRNHPSIFTWVLASDLLPHPDLERTYGAKLAAADGTRPPLASCGWVTSEVSGPSGVKMNGPYDWVPPRYWYEDRERGGAYGFNTETGPGPQPPPLESVKKMIPPEHLWPIDEVWNYHCGRNEFNQMNRYIEALDRRYGPSASVEEFLRKAQAASYEAIRPMFEAFAVNRPLTTGVIQWMLNSAWPEMYWQLYDHSLMPNGAFYGTRAACQPLNLAYNYHDRTVHLVNDTLARREAVATVRALDLQGREFEKTTREVAIDGGSSSMLLSLAGLEPPTPVWFLDLRLADREGLEVARNFYWLSTTEDVLDWEGSLWFVTPTKSFADFTALNQLPEVALEVEAGVERPAPDLEIWVRLTNPTDAVAFFVELRFVNARDESYLPVLWDDNYLTLLPGEERLVRARLPHAGALDGAAVTIAGWNVPETAAALSAGTATSSRQGSS